MILLLCSSAPFFRNKIEALRPMITFGVSVKAISTGTPPLTWLWPLPEHYGNYLEWHVGTKSFITRLVEETSADLHDKNLGVIEASDVAYGPVPMDETSNLLPYRRCLWEEVLLDLRIDVDGLQLFADADERKMLCNSRDRVMHLELKAFSQLENVFRQFSSELLKKAARSRRGRRRRR